MSDDVDVIDITKTTDDSHIESQIQTWLNNNSSATLDHVVRVTDKSNRVKLAFIHTDA